MAATPMDDIDGMTRAPATTVSRSPVMATPLPLVPRATMGLKAPRIYDWDGNAWVKRGSDIDGEAAGDRSDFRLNLR